MARKVIPKDGLLEIVSCDENGKAVFTTDIPVGAKLYVKEVSADSHYVVSDTQYPVVFEYAGQENESANETQQQRYDYWVAFQDYAFQNAQFAKNFNRRKPSMDHWMNFSVGSSACHIAVSQIQKRNELVVEIYISEDKELFHSLFDKKDAIEADAGLTFDWRELPER